MYSIIVLKNVPRQLHVLSVVVKRVTGRKQTLCPLQRSNPMVASTHTVGQGDVCWVPIDEKGFCRCLNTLGPNYKFKGVVPTLKGRGN